MRPPCEIISQELLPLLRGFVAFELAKKMTQQEVAEKMGISQPTVSSYLKSLEKIKQDDKGYFENATIKNLVKDISEKMQSNYSTEEIIRLICTNCVSLRIGGLTCRKHIDSYSSITQGCTGCLPIIDRNISTDRQKILKELDNAISLIENSTSFRKLMPQVRINLCQSISHPKTVDDVAAIPGRITKIRDRVVALLPAEFGVSEHTAKILINLNKINSKIQSIICIKYSKALKDAIAAIMPLIEIETTFLREFSNNYLTELEIMELMPKTTIKKIQSFQKEDAMALINEGGVGIEPIIYLTSNSAKKLVEMCSILAKKI